MGRMTFLRPESIGRGRYAPSVVTSPFTKGVWTDITPPGLGLNPHVFPSYGSVWVEVAPSAANIVFACFDSIGLFKSTNRGVTWAPCGSFDSPWSIRVNPANPLHAYLTQGVRGTTFGFFVTTDGGVSWTKPAGFSSLCATLGNGEDVTQMDVDPTDFSHIILSSHTSWTGFSNNGIMRSVNGGATWTAINPAWASAASTTPVHFLYDPATAQGHAGRWLVGTDGDGMWLTNDFGATWNKVSTVDIPHGGQSHVYTSTGKLIVGAAGTPLASANNGASFAPVGGSLDNFYYYGVWKDAVGRLYTAKAYTGDLAGQPDCTIFISDDDGASWQALNGQTFTDGFFNAVGIGDLVYGAMWGAGLRVYRTL